MMLSVKVPRKANTTCRLAYIIMDLPVSERCEGLDSRYHDQPNEEIEDEWNGNTRNLEADITPEIRNMALCSSYDESTPALGVDPTLHASLGGMTEVCISYS